jgi:hypothetical protein
MIGGYPRKFQPLLVGTHAVEIRFKYFMSACYLRTHIGLSSGAARSVP